MHQHRKNHPADPAGYTEEERNTVAAWIERQYGRPEAMLYSRGMGRVNVDLALIPPHTADEGYILVTFGFGGFRMNAPEGEPDRVELFMRLPHWWRFGRPFPRWNWPVGTLINLTEFPAEKQAWLGYGHTIDFTRIIPGQDSFSGVMLLPGAEEDCLLPDETHVRFCQVVPLQPEEIAFAQENDAEALLKTAVQFGFGNIIKGAPLWEDRPCMLRSDLLDDVGRYSQLIEEMQLSLDEVDIVSHMAAFLRWMIRRRLISRQFREVFADVAKEVVYGKHTGDLRIVLLHRLRGCLRGRYFNAEGQAFARWYYDFGNEQGYLADLKKQSVETFGEQGCDKHVCQGKPYLFMPWNEQYARSLNRLIDRRYVWWRRHLRKKR